MSGRIEQRTDRVDAAGKSSGRTLYVADLKFPDLLHALTLRSQKARAEILDIRLPELPPGYTTVGATDVPGTNSVHMIGDDWPYFAAERVNYVGEPILLLVGPDLETLAGLLAATEVRYRELDPILTVAEAERGDKEPLFGTDNRFADYQVSKGDPESAFRQAARVFAAEYSSGYQEHAYLEPQGMVGVYQEGRISVFGSLQCPYYVKTALVQGLGWPQERVRVVQVPTGGAFGGKEDYPSLLAGHVAFAALKTKHPVRIILDRREDIRATTKRHPAHIRLQTALDEDNRILALKAEIVLDGGAYAGLSEVVLQRSMFALPGVYAVPHVQVRARAVATNTVPTGAFRGFGSPQSFFALETHLDWLARRLGEEPLDFKQRHLLTQGGTTLTGGTLRQEVKLPELIEAACRLSGYREKAAAAGLRDGAYRGIGMSLFFHGCAFTGSGEQEKIKARVGLRKLPDGRVEILVASTEMGQGAQTTLRKIVAEILHIDMEQIIYDNPDTARVPDSGPTVASRTVMIVGGLLAEAARELAGRWDEQPQLELFKQYSQPPGVHWDQASFSGDAYPTYAWGVEVVEVAVDPVTFDIDVTGAWGAFDVGRAIDTQIIRGQIEGGMAQGLGYATIEVLEREGGVLRQDTLTDYIIATAKDVPAFGHQLVNSPYEHGPFGAKGAGELPFVGAAPAAAAAVQSALGLPVTRIPIRPETLHGMSRGARISGTPAKGAPAKGAAGEEEAGRED
jgi:CO/xanthine dehydrogenase Mo-binding subunit